jgi:hypothetical protein
MDISNYRDVQVSKLEEDTPVKEAQATCQMLQIIDNTEKTRVELEIKKAELAKAQSEVEKTKSEIKTNKIERIAKIGGLVITGLGTLVTAGTLIIVNGMNIESHKDEELKYSDDERDRERSISGKVLDIFTKRK